VIVTGIGLLLLQAVAPQSVQAPPVDLPVQMGYRVSPDTVLIGQPFNLFIKVNAPKGVRFEFPSGPDTATQNGIRPIELRGEKLVSMLGDTAVALYRLVAWDVGAQPLRFPDVRVTFEGQERRPQLGSAAVFVKSVLPADTTLHVPKPARPLIVLPVFNWLLWLALLAAAIVAALLWWAWRRYRNRPKAPVDPYARAQEEFAQIDRRRLLETGRIDAAARDAALRVPLDGRLHGPDIELDAPWIAEMARAEMVARFGAAALIDGYRVRTTVDSRLQALADASARQAILEYERRHGYRGPLAQIESSALGDDDAVKTAFREHGNLGNLAVALVESVGEKAAVVRLRDDRRIDLRWEDLSWARRALPEDKLGPAPASAAEVLAPGQLVYLEPLAEGHWRLAQQPAVAGALVAIDPTDGAIVAVTGGFAFFDSRYNRALQARRQPGSAFKPFLYSAALERGFTPATLINDAPIVIEGGTPEEEWRPQNITKRFYGPTPLREGLVRSRNLVSIRVLRGTGLGHAIKHIGQFGFGAEALPTNLTLALGTGQVTPLAMARGFAVFANGGYLVTPYAVERVTDAAGNPVFQATPKLACPGCVQATGLGQVATGPVPPDRVAPVAITPANAFVMTDMMVDVIQRGTAQLAKSIGRLDLAGKTGTTNDRRDAWFVGYNADLTVATWIGFDQERTLGEHEEGARTALPMWVHFMAEALRGVPEHRQPEPPGIVRMWVSRGTGSLASAGEFGAVFEVFLAGHAPLSGGVVDSGGLADSIDAESVEPASSEESIF